MMNVFIVIPVFIFIFVLSVASTARDSDLAEDYGRTVGLPDSTENVVTGKKSKRFDLKSSGRVPVFVFRFKLRDAARSLGCVGRRGENNGSIHRLGAMDVTVFGMIVELTLVMCPGIEDCQTETKKRGNKVF